jgi:uncharacterized protein YkwD
MRRKWLKKPLVVLLTLMILFATALPAEAAVPTSGRAVVGSTSSSYAVSDVPAGAVFLENYARDVFNIVNQRRAENGLSALVWNNLAAEAAQARAIELATSFSHTRPDGSTCFTALKAVGYSYSTAGENIAAGWVTPEIVMTAWMNSPGHRANILNEEFATVGVGCVYVPDDPKGYHFYWVQLFGTGSSNLKTEHDNGYVDVYRLFNPMSGEHLYSKDANELNALLNQGWGVNENVKWTSPQTKIDGSTPVFRVYNPISGEHVYTKDVNESTTLRGKYGWKDEGVCWYSAGSTPVYRVFNPRSGEHIFTADVNEKNVLISQHGWNDEGIGWYGTSAN